jgi:hypothetical protein
MAVPCYALEARSRDARLTLIVSLLVPPYLALLGLPFLSR